MINTPAPQESSPVKERCPIDGLAAFFYTATGVCYKCRRCRQEHVVQWEEILQRYAELQNSSLLQIAPQ